MQGGFSACDVTPKLGHRTLVEMKKTDCMMYVPDSSKVKRPDVQFCVHHF